MLEPWIAPSILSADFARLGEEVGDVLAAGADLVHFDVMDNHYVPNLTVGPLVCAALRKAGVEAPIDVHLMVRPVDRIVPDFAKAGATWISFHPEATEHVDRTIGLIREQRLPAGAGVEPGDAVELAGSRARQDRPGASDVGQPRVSADSRSSRACCRRSGACASSSIAAAGRYGSKSMAA